MSIKVFAPTNTTYCAALQLLRAAESMPVFLQVGWMELVLRLQRHGRVWFALDGQCASLYIVGCRGDHGRPVARCMVTVTVRLSQHRGPVAWAGRVDLSVVAGQ